MNPVFLPQSPLECPICLTESVSQHVKWHLPLDSQRAHSSCLDCATVICQRAIQESQEYRKTTSCPECRKIVNLESDRFVSREVIQTALKVSLGYFIMRFLAYPLIYPIAQMCLSHGTFFHLVNLWTYRDFDRPDWIKVQEAIQMLVRADQADQIVEELVNILAIIKKTGDFCFALFVILIAKHIHDKNYPHPIKCDVIMVALINLVFFGLYFHFTTSLRNTSLGGMTESVKQGINPLKEELQSILGGSWTQDLLIGIMPIFSAAFIYLKSKEHDLENPKNIKEALLNSQLLFSDEE